ncbi:conserved phage C-terminal domain-containing protein [Chryseobacterium scophthalmum]|uniref:conserved phage C-terminal domain-containing protein n=1 Tax=Chryseobacterium scophthalmum TaxID=59733 RepID=UPI000C9DD727|nr:conserved phage C-terminal domain-containing protein [Chryseobacterium scophthalmum]
MIETEILNFLNEATGSKFREIKSNISKIKALLQQDFTKEQIIEVIQLKVIQWKNNPKMAMYLRPRTLFSNENFENYINEIERIKQNPKMYAEHFKQINNIKTSAADDVDDLKAMFG